MDFLGGSEHMKVEELGKSLDMASIVTRMARGEQEVVGTEEDCVRECVRMLAGCRVRTRRSK